MGEHQGRIRVNRRSVLRGATAFGGSLVAGKWSGVLAISGAAQAPPGPAPGPAIVTPDQQRPQLPYGAMSGDPSGRQAIIWSKTDRPARTLVELATREDFRDARRVAGPAALATSDYTARVDLEAGCFHHPPSRSH